MFDQLFPMDLENYTNLMLVWGAVGLVSAASLFLKKMLPMSSKVDSGGLAFLGMIDKRTGWIIMETPILVTVITTFLWFGGVPLSVSGLMVAAFVMHYTNRALVYPFRIKVAGKKMPVSIMFTSMIFYIVNGSLISYYFATLRDYPLEWLYDPRFLLGAGLFLFGFIVNIQSDNILINLRKPGETGYKIPRVGFYRYVSCPNYFGEIVEWIGFAIMTWSLPGVVYAIWVALPLFAQGLSAHQWYVEKFGDEYPVERKAIIPKLI